MLALGRDFPGPARTNFGAKSLKNRERRYPAGLREKEFWRAAPDSDDHYVYAIAL
jgi:hypothetical protein